MNLNKEFNIHFKSDHTGIINEVLYGEGRGGEESGIAMVELKSLRFFYFTRQNFISTPRLNKGIRIFDFPEEITSGVRSPSVSGEGLFMEYGRLESHLLENSFFRTYTFKASKNTFP